MNLHIFENWSGLLRVPLAALFTYLFLIFYLRWSGKQVLSKLSAYDLVVTVALGSMVATVILSRETPLLEGLLGIASLISLQMILAWLIKHSDRVQKLMRSRPALLFDRGIFLPAAMSKELVTEEEVREAVRLEGITSLEEVETVVLEPNGELSVTRRASPPATALERLGRRKVL